jgi:HEPN domain-containing protein
MRENWFMMEVYKEWFRKGDNDLLNIENNLKSEFIPADTVCFHSQQIAEKYIKGYLTYKGVIIEKTHNLLLLLQQCIQIDPGFESLREPMSILNGYSISSRYPDFSADIDEKEARESYQMAVMIRSYILSKIA